LRFPHALRKARQPRTLFFLRFGICRQGLVCGLTRAARRDRLWLEEGLRRRRGRRSGFLTFLAGNGDVLAASEPLSLVGIAREGSVARPSALGVQRNSPFVQSDLLDGRVGRARGAFARNPFLRPQRRWAAGQPRAVKLAALGGLAQPREALTAELLSDLF